MLVSGAMAAAIRFAFVRAPWHATYIAVYAAFAGMAGESLLIEAINYKNDKLQMPPKGKLPAPAMR